MTIPSHIEIKTYAGVRAAFLSPKADGLKGCYPDCRLNGESTLEFMLPATSQKISHLTPECQIWAGGRVYSLLNPDATDMVREESGNIWVKFMAVERWKELETSFIEPSLSNDPSSPLPSDLAVIIVGSGFNLSGGLYQTGTAAHALYSVLNGSGWTLGTCDVPGIRDIEAEKVSRLELVKMIQDIWGGYLVWDSVNKTVSLRNANAWQPYNGFQIRYAKNLKHITRTQSNRIITKLYAFGHDDLDISSVNGGKKYITNFSYTSREYIGIYKNQDIYNAQELLEKTTAELTLISKPQFLYRVKIVDLRTIPEFSHEDFAIGDMADVIDPNVAPDKPRARIIRHKYNLFEPWDCEFEIGDPEERLIEKMKASFDTSNFIDGKYNGSGKNSGYSIEDLTIDNAKIIHLSANKITAGTITAEISIISPYIYGGTIVGGSIISNTSINVTTDLRVGNNIYLRLAQSGQSSIYFGENYTNAFGVIRSDPVSGNFMIGFPNLSAGAHLIMLPNGSMFINSNDVTAKGAWDCNNAEFRNLWNGSSYYATQAWAARKGINTGSNSHSHTITIDGKTYTTSSESHSHAQA